MKWFTSDWHLYHKNIIKYDGRPFSSVEEMNDTIITNCNELVLPGDELYFLGDFAFCKDSEKEKTFSLLRDMIVCPNIHFIRGNHDPHHSFLKRFFTTVSDFKEIKISPSKESKGNPISVTLCHYALRVWNKSHHGAYHLYGHSHHTLPDDPHSRSFDIGVNGWDYKPLNEDQIHEIMSRKIWKPIDHHVGNEKVSNTEYKYLLEKKLYEQLKQKFENEV